MLSLLKDHSIDTSRPQPLYLQLSQIIRQLIEQGKLPEGTLLPSEHQLMRRYQISRTTVRLAMQDLEEQGYVIRRRGKGSFVTLPKITRQLNRLYSFSHDMQELGMRPSSKVLAFRRLPADAGLAEHFQLPQQTPLFVFTRLRLADNHPLLLEKTCLPVRFFPDLSASRLEQGSLYQALGRQGLVMDRAVESYEPVLMSEEDSRLLASEDNRLAFAIERTSYTLSGDIFEWTHSLMAGKRSRLEVTLHQNRVQFNRRY